MKILFQQIAVILLQIILSISIYAFFYNMFNKIYLKGRQWSSTMPEMLKEDRITSIITLLASLVVLGITIVINILYKPFIGFYLVSIFLLFMCSDLIFPIKGRKISDNCYVMIYHIDHFIVTLNGRKIWIKGKRLRGDPDQIIYREESPKWLPPHENDSVSNDDYEFALNAIVKFEQKNRRECIIKNFQDAK